MRKIDSFYGGRRISVNYQADIPLKRCPKITGEEIRGSERLYVDADGGRHVAEVFDRIWGKRDSNAILPKSKSQFQRIRKM